jgi:hypothetical protein
LGPELGLALVSAALTGALFLLVIMLTEGWGNSPLEAALIVSAMPVSTVIARRLTRGVGQSTAVIAAGAIAASASRSRCPASPAVRSPARIPPGTARRGRSPRAISASCLVCWF